MTQHKEDPLGTPGGDYSQKVCERYFGPTANAADAMRLKNEHPGEYTSIRACSVARGLIGPASYRTNADKAKPQAKTIDAATIAARSKHPREEVRALLTKKDGEPGESWASIKKTDPDRFASLRLAALSYNLITERPQRQQPTPKEAPKDAEPNDGSVEIPSDLVEKLGLAPGTRISPADLAGLLQTSASEAGEKARKAIEEAHLIAQQQEREANKAKMRAAIAAEQAKAQVK